MPLCPYPPLTCGKAQAAVDVLPWGNGSAWENRQPQYLPVQGWLAVEMDALSKPRERLHQCDSGDLGREDGTQRWLPCHHAKLPVPVLPWLYGPTRARLVLQDMEGDADFPAWTSSP